MSIDTLPEPFAHICILPTHDAGNAKFFTAKSDQRGFAVYTADQLHAALAAQAEAHAVQMRKANAQAEHFEREWYLRGDEIDALRAQVEALHRERGLSWSYKP
jgi:hypothetical protein